MARHRMPSAGALAAVALAAILGAGMLLATGAAAHTHLASTTPSDGSRTPIAPTAVVLRFTQPIDARTAVLRVVDQHGRSVPIATRVGGDGIVRVALRRSLANGDYAVGYRVLAGDGHAMRGGLAFTVAARPGGASHGSTAATAALIAGAVPGDAPWTRPVLVAARAGQYAGLVLALGGVTFLLLAWWPALAAAGPGRRDHGAATWRRTLATAVMLGTASAAGGLVAHAFDAAGARAGAERVVSGLTDPAGILWLDATACWLVAAVLLRRAAPLDIRTAKRLLAPLAGALLATALSGHGGRDADAAVIAAAIVHGTAAAIWIGALAWLGLASRRRHGLAAVLPAAAARVSRLSLAAAVATLASGTVQAVTLAGGPLTLPGSSYGRLVLVKLALFGGLVALGAVHRRRALPALRAGSGRVAATATVRPLRATLRAELALAVVVLGTASALTSSEPPQREADAPAPAALAGVAHGSNR